MIHWESRGRKRLCADILEYTWKKRAELRRNSLKYSQSKDRDLNPETPAYKIEEVSTMPDVHPLKIFVWHFKRLSLSIYPDYLPPNAKTKSTTFWNITPCSPLEVNWRFGGTYRLHLQGRIICRARKNTNAAQ
jgi:hypothetical protein